MTAKFAAVVCVLLALNGVHSSPLGAPLAACGDMTPQHGVDPQTSPAPFTTTVDTVPILAIRFSTHFRLNDSHLA